MKKLVRVTRNSSRITLADLVDNSTAVAEDFIDKFWIEMHKRFDQTDLSAGPTSFSEAPAESVFSGLKRIIRYMVYLYFFPILC